MNNNDAADAMGGSRRPAGGCRTEIPVSQRLDTDTNTFQDKASSNSYTRAYTVFSREPVNQERQIQSAVSANLLERLNLPLSTFALVSSSPSAS